VAVRFLPPSFAEGDEYKTLSELYFTENKNAGRD